MLSNNRRKTFDLKLAIQVSTILLAVGGFYALANAHLNSRDEHMTVEKSQNIAIMVSEFEISKETQLKLREDVNLTITSIAVINNKLENIVTGISEIKELIKTGGN